MNVDMSYSRGGHRPQARLLRGAREYAGWIWLPLLGIVVGYLVMNLDNGVRFPVREVRIEGHFRFLDPARLQRLIGPLLRDGFFGADLRAVRRRLVAEPWVREASVRRLWPDGLQVSVVEQQPLVRWGDMGFINRSGTLVQLPDALHEPSLPLLQGPPDSHGALLRHYLEFERILEPAGLHVRALLADERGALKTLLDNGWLVVLGRTAVTRRFERFTRFAYEVLQPDTEAVRVVDMRYANGYAVRWRDGAPPYAGATVQR